MKTECGEVECLLLRWKDSVWFLGGGSILVFWNVVKIPV